MWRSTNTADQKPEDLTANLAQLRHSTLQRLIITSAGFYLLMQLAFSATWPALFGWPIVPVFGIVTVSTGLAYLLLTRHLGVAHVVWQVYIYRTAFGSDMGGIGVPRLGYASAAGVVFGVSIMVIALLQTWGIRNMRDVRSGLEASGQ